jgi:peptide/nickel transport system substrate-binding protein
MALVRGDIDLIAHQGGVPATHVAWLRQQPGIVVASQDVAITHYLLFNNARPPFQDSASREAFDRLLDRTGMVATLLGGAGTPADDFLIPRARDWHRGRFSVTPLPSGPPDVRLTMRPLSLVLSQGDATSWGYRQLADYVVERARRAGIRIDVTTLEGGAWQQAIERSEYDLTMYPLSTPTGTPELLTRRLAYSRGMRVRGIGNSTHYASPEADRLFDAAVFATEAGVQVSTFNALLDLLARDKPFVPLYHERYFYAYRRGLTGVRVDPFLKIDLWNVHRAKAGE